MEKKTVDLIVGKKVEDAEVKGDQGKHREVHGSPVPMESGGGGEVGGRSGHAYVLCPHCGAVNYVWVDDYTYIWYRCWRNHSHLFKV